MKHQSRIQTTAQVADPQITVSGETFTASRSLSLPTAHPVNQTFLARLQSYCATYPAPQKWLYVPYDQLSLTLTPLDQGPKEWGIILIESGAWERIRPYHIQRIASLLLNQRMFAIEAAQAGFQVRYHIHEEALEQILDQAILGLEPVAVRYPAERCLRFALDPLRASGRLNVLPHQGWLSTPEQFEQAVGARPPWKMDSFYRSMRKISGLLMEGNQPIGGKWSYDHENRKAWKGEPPAPQLPKFRQSKEAKLIRDELKHWLKEAYTHHPGHLDLEAIPASSEEHEQLWEWVKQQALPYFGPYEDAMSSQQSTLFHSRLSLSINLHRLSAHRLVTEVEALPIPLSCREGFIRQLIGWREFVRHVHLRTEGHRQGLHGAVPTSEHVGDAGYALWKGRSWISPGWTPGITRAIEQGWRPQMQRVEDGGAIPNAMTGGRDAPYPLPTVYWGTRSGLNCLDQVVADVWQEGWSHHITRLMVLANWGTLLGISPRALTDWFWIAYVDAFDWVVEPNVLGMATYATEGLMTTKPYVSGSAYIDKMSDYCTQCQYQPKLKKGDHRPLCPMTAAYWDFLHRNRSLLQGNHRLSLPLASEAKRDPSLRHEATEQLQTLWKHLASL